MSQLINATSLGNVLIVTGSFVVLLILLKAFAWEKITAVFEERAQKISDDIDGAENARKHAEALASKREEELASSRKEATAIIQTAKATADNQRAAALAETQEEIGRLKDKAKQDIEQSKNEALSSVKDEVADLSLALASKLVARELDQSAQSELIDQYIKQLGEA